jgi:hypothetical protein
MGDHADGTTLSEKAALHARHQHLDIREGLLDQRHLDIREGLLDQQLTLINQRDADSQ